MVPQGPTPGNTALPQSSTVRHGDAFAIAAPNVADALGDLLQHDLAQWQRHGLERIKLRTVRRVFRGRLGDADVHIKAFRADTIAARARDALRRGSGKGEREARHLQMARDLGLAAVEPLAFGMALENGQACSFLVTRTAAPRTFALGAAHPDEARRVGELLRRVHDLGLHAGDLHPGNVLMPDSGTPTLCDLTSLHRADTMSLKQRASGLAFFCNELDGGACDDEAAALLAGYRATGPELPASFDRELQLAANRWRATALRSFARRSSRACRHTEVAPRRRGKPRWLWFLGNGGVGDANCAVRASCMGFDDTDARPLREGRRGAVWRLDDVVIKQRDAGKAKHLWRAHYLLHFAGVPTAAPLALRLHAGRGRVFTRRLEAENLAHELADGLLDRHALAAAAERLGDAVGRMHAHGLRNRDLKFENLVRDPVTGAICMVDLDGVRLHGAGDTRGCGRDLGRLLAAHRRAGEPGGASVQRRFVAGYLSSRRKLLQNPPVHRLLRRARERAGEWARTHPDEKRTD